MDLKCWAIDCQRLGESRPVFAHVHRLPATLRLCDPHLSTLSSDPKLIRALLDLDRDHSPTGG